MLSLCPPRSPDSNRLGALCAPAALAQHTKAKAYALVPMFLALFADSASGGTRRDEQECVILVHGLARGAGSLWLMEKALNRQGYRVLNAVYPSTTAGIAELAEHVGLAVERCGSRPVHFVTHSLGGILVRYWLTHKIRPHHLGRVVMLAPPNHGSEIVDVFGKMLPFEWINGPAGKELGTGADTIANMLPAPDYPVGIIAGDISVNPIFNSVLPGPNDGKVTVESTKLDGAADHLIVHATHTFMTYNPIVVMETLNFLERGSFQHGISFATASRKLMRVFE